MLRYLFKRFLRQPLIPIAIMLAAAVLSVILCSIRAASDAEALDYANIYRATPVTLTVTNLTGTDANDLDAPQWALNVFTADYRTTNDLSKYIKDLQVKMVCNGVQQVQIGDKNYGRSQLIGITDIRAEINLGPQSGNKIEWLDGYDNSSLGGKELFCLLPASMLPETGASEISITISYQPGMDPKNIVYHTRTLKVAGIHQADSNIYCPFSVLQSIYSSLGKPLEIYSISAVVADNFLLEDVKEAAAYWFAEPSISGEETPWNYSWYSYYPYALKIDDSQLRGAEETMENSRIINGICAMLVFVLSVASGFIIGFLTVRIRKREIALMRTMGTPNREIYGSFAFEQMVCVMLGTVLGGAAFVWNPAGELLIFDSVYFIGLSAALIIFLRKNLLTTIKEDE